MEASAAVLFITVTALPRFQKQDVGGDKGGRLLWGVYTERSRSGGL